MANVCSNTVLITGPKDEVKKFDDLITSADKDLLEVFPWFTEDTRGYGTSYRSMQGDDCLMICFDSKWSPPEIELRQLSQHYPKLRFTVNAQEPAMEVFCKLEYENGECLCDESLDADTYYTEYDEDYAQEKNDIAQLTSQEAVKYILDKAEVDYPIQWSLLEPFVLERVEYHEMPLLINYEWQSDAGKTYKLRLQGKEVPVEG